MDVCKQIVGRIKPNKSMSTYWNILLPFLAKLLPYQLTNWCNNHQHPTDKSSGTRLARSMVTSVPEQLYKHYMYFGIDIFPPNWNSNKRAKWKLQRITVHTAHWYVDCRVYSILCVLCNVYTRCDVGHRYLMIKEQYQIMILIVNPLADIFAAINHFYKWH